MNAFGELLEFISILYELILGFGDFVFFVFNLKVSEVIEYTIPYGIPAAIIKFIADSTIGDYSLLVVTFGSGITLFVGLTIIKWIIGIVQ